MEGLPTCWECPGGCGCGTALHSSIGGLTSTCGNTATGGWGRPNQVGRRIRTAALACADHGVPRPRLVKRSPLQLRTTTPEWARDEECTWSRRVAARPQERRSLV